MSEESRQRVLIANRGEIALRAVKACATLGLQSVAVFSSADRKSLHATSADTAICIGPPQSRDSYLNQDALIHIAQFIGCSLIYPGYGFLAENPGFARRCEMEGLKFIGPSADCIETMGDKARARQTAVELGVPVVPGSATTFEDSECAVKEADRIGFPLLLKATAGGGGRGMRIAETEEEFRSRFDQASGEALEAFGNPAMYLERYFPRVRHIEVQIFADQSGNICELGERDCTIQRRHQKLVEESPSPVLSDDERQAIIADALILVNGVRYEGAGTVEFIFDESERNHYFIEMNTRIQVEHPVSELRVGQDLVEQQIRIALGEPLSLATREDWANCHAIEFRINAEDPDNNFQPDPGTVSRWRPPMGRHVRVDSFVYEGFRIPPFYDSMVAKLLVHGKDRTQALERARHCFEQFEIQGIASTKSFHRKLLGHPDFIASRVHTKWVEQEFLGE